MKTLTISMLTLFIVFTTCPYVLAFGAAPDNPDSGGAITSVPAETACHAGGSCKCASCPGTDGGCVFVGGACYRVQN